MAPRVYSYVRFSKPEQALGDSLRRQTEQAEKYAADHGMVLDRSLKADEGLSAYSGANLKRGHLGAFIEKVKSGHVPRGSTLLVESLDRLSRKDVQDAQAMFLEVINLGVRVVTLCDNQTYDQASIKANWATLIVSMALFARANEESETKSKRCKAAWQQKRDSIGSEKLSKWCPGWLRLSPDRTKYVGIPERVEGVKRIFKLIQQGRSNASVARLFNEEGVEQWGIGRRKGRMWNQSYIQKIITSRAVLGEGQPCAMSQGKRIPSGPVITGYYPRIISDEQFLRVQSLRAGRQRYGGRKVWDAEQKDYRVPNLFRHIIRCGRCGLPIVFINKGAGRGGGERLVCSGSLYHAGTCKYRSIRYARVENEILTYLRELDWATLSSEAAQVESDLSVIQAKIENIHSAIAAHEQKIEMLIEGMGRSGFSPPEVVTKIHTLGEENAVRQRELKSLEAEHRTKSNSHQNISAHGVVMRKNIHSQQKGGVLDPTIRTRLREQLLALVKRIELIVDPEWKDIQKKYGKGRDLRATRLLFPEDEERRIFISINFATGATRWLLLSNAGGVAQEIF